MRYRIIHVYSYWCGLTWHTQYRRKWIPFWINGPAFASESEARAWIEWDEKNGGKGYEVIMESPSRTD